MADQTPNRKRKRTNQPATPQQGDPQPQQQQQQQHNDMFKGGRYHCNYCAIDISNEVRIKCAQCPDFDLCVNCFYVGVETSAHKRDHQYRVMDDMSTPLFSTTWGADEELLLLEGIELFGLGNWADVAEHVGTKNKFQCEYHYWTTYVDVPTFPLPDTAAPVKQEPEVTENTVRRDDQGMLVAVVGNKAVFNPIDEARRQLKKNNIGSEVGFMPLRGDYEVEYSNNAEEIVGELEITDDDTPDERKLKVKLLEMYDFKLCERERRKNFALERGVCDWKKTHNIEKKRSKEERDMYTKFRCFTRFMPQNKFDELVDGIINERRIRKRIEQLKQYRSAGVLTFKKAEQYEIDKKRRESDWEQRKSSIRTPSVRGNRTRANQSGFDDPIMTPVSAIPSAMKTRKPGVFDGNLLMSEEELKGHPGVELLTSKERELCTTLCIVPKQYMLMKDVLIRESFRLNVLSKASACKLLENFDRTKACKLYDFMAQCGWIQPPAES